MADPTFFNNTTYEPAAEPSASPRNLIDGSQALANKGYVIGFEHVPSETKVYFKAFITAFNETYASDWNSETVYGRADPIYMFKNTTRKITLAFKVPCSTKGEAYGNLAKVQTLLQFLYPTYANVDSATTITQSPLVRIQVMNLLTKVSTATPADTGPALYTAYTSTADANKGLLGAINNLSVNHNLDNTDIGVIEMGTKENPHSAILPKMIEINLDFSAIHEEPLGWEDNSFRSQLFPYGALGVDADTAGSATDLSFLHTTEFNPASIPQSDTGYSINEVYDPETGEVTILPGSSEDADATVVESSDSAAANVAAKLTEVWNSFTNGNS